MAEDESSIDGGPGVSLVPRGCRLSQPPQLSFVSKLTRILPGGILESSAGEVDSVIGSLPPMLPLRT